MSPVSIILPTYNRAEYLAEAVKSCLNQTYADIEVVVVDDGSTDRTPKLMEYLLGTDSRLVYLPFGETNRGPAMAMNYGMGRATGSVFMFAASDDIQLPEKVERGLLALGTADIGYTGYYHCDDRARIFEYCPPLPLTLENIRGNTAASGEALVIRKEVFGRTPFRDMPFNEDQAFLVDAYKAGYTYGMLDEPTFRYRLLRTGLSYANKKAVDLSVKELQKELDEWHAESR